MNGKLFLSDFEALCKQIFSFLIEHDCFFQKSENFGLVFFRILFVNKTTGIMCDYDIREGVEVSLIRLKDGKLPVYSPENWFSVGELLNIYEADKKFDTSYLDERREIDVYDLKGIESVLIQYAEVLKKYGHIVISGDFSVFSGRWKSYEELWEELDRKNKGDIL